MAEKLGVSQMAYSKIERNKSQLNWAKLIKIAEILNLNIWDLVSESLDSKEISIKNRSSSELIDMLDQLLGKYEEKIAKLEEKVHELENFRTKKNI